MPRPHREIPSQRLAVARSKAPAAPPEPHRSVWWAVGITLVGCALLAYPVVLLPLLSIIVMTGTLESTSAAPGIALGITGFVFTLAMVAFPLLLGLAVKTRRRAFWIAAIVTGAMSVAACIYLTVEWLIPLN
ncbi:hypothetical protein JOF48_000548 [Arthrobacter stackebrandtii]|uniref:MFS transporter n=1 Tax=Arthrobacter stackebrandtii TaxID=272161 RepID=A0ABS4YSN8_9MICC|nr:hypothetical protein [Arthrobacter stackebrandtii]MBP2411749.1 hypothetical protein [Arthrobacter stackebrandtii]PYG99146.1 hypothetical protein CVV67_16445 [Arthrobacter stackebrandtii]